MVFTIQPGDIYNFDETDFAMGIIATSRLQIADVGYRDEIQVQLWISIGCPTVYVGYPTNIRASIKFANLSYSRLSGDSYEADKPLF